MSTESKEEKIQELAMRFIEARHGNLDMLGFEIQDISPSTEDSVWIVRCRLFPKIGFEEKIAYNARINLKTEEVILEEA